MFGKGEQGASELKTQNIRDPGKGHRENLFGDDL